ncbi:RING-H2 finger protein ATL2 [Lotus japonicus]|uniref:RING-H2 finger protein ATL2 n=1 Tax=Lotus japonicus TaxID=34305 RepID=UPI00258AF28D|nr:RING-H2 finger protein ATL2 [Lotus japonicus]
MDNGYSDETERRHYAFSGKIMLISVIVLFVVIIIVVCLHLQLRWYLLHARRRRRQNITRRRRSQFFFYVDPSVSTAATRGLDASVISSLPIFTFSPKTHPDPVECAVCLSELEDGETGRVLPKCNHTFHVDCIDMWFHSHSTCPLCRVPVEPAPEMVTRSDVTDPELGSSSGLCSECEQGVSVSVEVPGRDDIRCDSSSFRSPMSRVLSLTRILSREKKVSVSPASGCEAGCSSMTMTELDAERGHESVVTRSAGV